MYSVRAIKNLIGKHYLLNMGTKSCFNKMSQIEYSSKQEVIDPDENLYRPRRLRSLKEGDIRVCIAGGAGSVGSKLALLLKTSPLIDAITMYDIEEHTYGVALDLSHIDSKCKVFQVRKRDRLQEALAGVNIVIICTSGVRRPSMTPDELFELNAEIVEEIATNTAMVSPQAYTLIVSQPVDSLTPLVGQVYRDANLDSKKKVIGITSANVMRATRVLAETLHCNPTDIIVPVIGGHTAETIVPVYSACVPMAGVNDAMELELCNKMLAIYKSSEPTEQMQRVISNMVYLVKHWDSWVHGSKPFDHSATITGAMAAYRTTVNLVSALRTKEHVIDTAFVETDVIPGLTYSTVPLKFGSDGVVECFNVPVNTLKEKELLKEAILHLEPAVTKGRQFAINSIINRSLGLPFNP